VKLREFQVLANDKVHVAFAEHQRVLGIAPTGSGKAVMSGALIEDCIQGRGAFVLSPRRALLLVNREELLQQGADKIHMVSGRYAAIERGHEHAVPGHPVVVATVQSMVKRLAKYPQDHFGLVIVDEAHLFATNQAKDVLDWFCKRELGGTAYLLGVTATPQTTGKKALAKIYDTIGYQIALPDLVKQGLLSNIKVRTCPVPIDIRHIRRVGGDLDPDQLDEVIRPYFRAVAEAMQEHGPDRKWLCFLPLIKTSQAFARILNEHGIPAKHIDGDSPDRSELLLQFKYGHFRALCCSSLLTTGYDEPSITGIVNLRPTQSRILLTQILGRGTRIKPEDSQHKDLLVLDFLWQYDLQDIITPATLVCPNEEDEAEVAKRLRSGQEMDLLGTSRDVAAERHAKLAKKLKEQEKRKSKLYDLSQLVEAYGEEDPYITEILDYEPTMAWHSARPSEKQLKALVRFGINADIVKDRGHASALIEFCMNNVKEGKPSIKQVACLRRWGMQAPDTFAEASRIIGQHIAQLDASRQPRYPARP